MLEVAVRKIKLVVVVMKGEVATLLMVASSLY